MSEKKIGRPPSDNPLSERIYLRVDKKTIAKLDSCAERLKTTRSDVVRQGIDMVHDFLEEK